MAPIRRGGWWLAVALAIFGGPGPALAGGPLGLLADGTPIRWDSSQTVRCVVSSGSLSSRSHDTAVAMVRRALQTWQQVPGTPLQIALTGELSRNVTGSNVAAFLDGLRGSDPSPILLDGDGSITDALNGQGAAGDVFGFSEPWLVNSRTGQIAVSFTVINGKLHDAYSDSFLLGTIVHELGHFMNLEHSLVNASLLFDGDPTNDGLTPVMFYRGPNDPATLTMDDQAWFSWLYPSSASPATGAIQGRVLLPDGVTGLQGVHVVARRIGDPQVTAVACVSGFQFYVPGVGGTSDPAYLGQYFIPNLPPGSYTVEVEQLVGYPGIPISPAYLVGGPKFWGKGSSAQDPRTASTVIPVSAGQTMTGIDIVLNGDTLGDPKPVQKSGSIPFSNPQHVRLPAVISGSVPDGPAETVSPGTIIRPLSSPNDLLDVYRVALGDWTIVTAILSAQSAAADLDLYVLGQQGNNVQLEDASTQRGTPPEVVQLRLSPGIHYFGVIRAGTKGSAYTLQLLATPAPDPATPPLMAYLGYLLIGDVTTSSATAHWITTDDTPSVLYYNQPQQEVGSTTPARDHMFSLTGMPPNLRSEVDVFAQSPGGVDELLTHLTTATDPAPDGTPHIVATSNATPLDNTGDVFQIESHLNNRGDADAHHVQIEQMILPDGWYFVWQASTGLSLPDTLDAGDIGTGGAGSFVAAIVRLSGSTDPHITLHGSYTDAAGTVMMF